MNNRTESAAAVEYIDNTPFRVAVLRSGVPLSVIDKALGVSQHRTARAVGIAKSFRYRDGEKVPYRQRRISYDLAVSLVRVLDLDPVEMGV